MALQQFVAWLLGRVNRCRAGNPITCNHHWTRHQLTNTLYHSKGLDQRSGSNPFERSGSEVWIGGLDRVWERGLIQTLHFEPQPYIQNYRSYIQTNNDQLYRTTQKEHCSSCSLQHVTIIALRIQYTNLKQKASPEQGPGTIKL